MMTLFIVKSLSKHYHIYNGVGDCVAVAFSRQEVSDYINEVFCPSQFTSYTVKHTAAPGTFIVTMK